MRTILQAVFAKIADPDSDLKPSPDRHALAKDPPTIARRFARQVQEVRTFLNRLDAHVHIDETSPQHRNPLSTNVEINRQGLAYDFYVTVTKNGGAILGRMGALRKPLMVVRDPAQIEIVTDTLGAIIAARLDEAQVTDAVKQSKKYIDFMTPAAA